MEDEYGFTLELGDYKFDYESSFNFFEGKVSRLDIDFYKKLSCLGVNPFDLFMIEVFLKENNIQNVLELGCGSTSKLLDVLKIKRKSFAIDCLCVDELEFEKINLFNEYSIVQEHIKNDNVDFVLIDCLHNQKMAELIHTKILSSTNFNTPIFIHDWFDFGKWTYTEQIYYYNNLFSDYDLYLMSDLPEEYINRLEYDENAVNNICHVPRCGAILIPKGWKI